MKILTFDTGEKTVSAFVVDDDADLLQRYPNETLIFRDMNGYCKDVVMESGLIRVKDINPDDVRVLIDYRCYIENEPVSIYRFMSHLQNIFDDERGI